MEKAYSIHYSNKILMEQVEISICQSWSGAEDVLFCGLRVFRCVDGRVLTSRYWLRVRVLV